MDPLQRFLSSVYHIIRLPRDASYLPNDSRTRNGLHAFLITFYKELRKKNRADCRLYVRAYVVPVEFTTLNEEEIYCLAPSLKRQYYDAMFNAYRQKAIAVWNSLDADAISAWKERAKKLNLVAVPGRFNECPQFFHGF